MAETGAPYYVWGSIVLGEGHSGSTTVAKPAGLAVDDIWITAVSGSRPAAMTFPGDWTQIANVPTNSGTNEHGEIWYKRATSADVASSSGFPLTVSSNSDTDWTYISVAYRGCAKATTPYGPVVTLSNFSADHQKVASGSNTTLSTGIYDTTSLGFILLAAQSGTDSGLVASSRGWELRGIASRSGSASAIADTTHPLPSNLSDADRYDMTYTHGNATTAAGIVFALRPQVPITNSQSPYATWWGSRTSTTSTTLTPTMRTTPSGFIASGDLLLAHIAISANRSSSLVSNHGYTKIGEIVQADGLLYHSVWRKIAGSSEPSPPTWTYTGAGVASSADLYRVRQFDAATPIEAVGTWSTSAAGTTANTISVPGAMPSGLRTNFAELAFTAVGVSGGLIDRLPDTSSIYSTYSYGAAREVGELTASPSMALHWRTFPGPEPSQIDVINTTTAVAGKVAGVQILVNPATTTAPIGEPGRAGFLGN